MNYIVLVIGVILGIMTLSFLIKDIYHKLNLYYILNKEYDINSRSEFIYDLLHISFSLKEFDAIFEKMDCLSELEDENALCASVESFTGGNDNEPRE